MNVSAGTSVQSSTLLILLEQKGIGCTFPIEVYVTRGR
jgi:hypothetical protein